MKVYQVNHVEVIKQSDSPLTLLIHASGLASSTGWTNPRLESPADPPEDAVLEFSFEADRPSGGVTLPVLVPITATAVVTPKHDVDAVVVSARTNSITVHASEFRPGATGAGAPGGMTTLALGEEGPPATTATASAVSPGVFTTLIVGEEGPHPTTLRFGEETPTTHLLGEEGVTTFIVGEENPTTQRLGEEGGPTTEIAGEENPTTLRFGEEGSTDPRVDDPIGNPFSGF